MKMGNDFLSNKVNPCLVELGKDLLCSRLGEILLQ